MQSIIEIVEAHDKTVAIIMREGKSPAGVTFVTPRNYSQQLATMSHCAGTSIMAHSHNLITREVTYTQEVLIIRRGRMRVDFYDDNETYLESRILMDGDVLMLVSGGHGFEVLEDLEMIEIKQGPYVGYADKTKFSGVKREDIRIVTEETR